MGKRSRSSTNKFKTENQVSKPKKKDWISVDVTDSWRSMALDGTESGFLSLEAFEPEDCSQTFEHSIEDIQDEQTKPLKKKKKKQTEKVVEAPPNPLEDSEMLEWEQFNLSPEIMKGLAHLRFQYPSPIQSLCIPAGISHKKNIIAASQTGSGKTLAFGIPMLDRMLRSPSEPSDIPLRGLVLTPTRELALQVTDHLKTVSKFCGLKIASIVGGMALSKQKRLLKNRPEIVVATPGRLWHWICDGDEHLKDFSRLEFIVIDEADRLICDGQFGDLYKILEEVAKYKVTVQRQVFLFSATLMSEADVKIKEMYQKITRTLGLNLEDKKKRKTAIFDLTSSTKTSFSLEEMQIQCTDIDKDLYLYYILATQPGKTLVFANSIASVRRMVSLFSLFNLPIWALHSNMQQRQRLKNLDRLKSLDHCILVCSDVAARGLDIPSVQLVVHYHAPRSSELYIHRSGRTARAGASGLSIALSSGEDSHFYSKLWKEIHDGNTVPEYHVDSDIVKVLRERLVVASKIDKETNFQSKRKSNRDWFTQSAEAMDIALDEQVMKTISYDDTSSEEKRISQRLEALKSRLSNLLGQTLETESKRKSSKFVTVSTELLK